MQKAQTSPAFLSVGSRRLGWFVLVGLTAATLAGCGGDSDETAALRERVAALESATPQPTASPSEAAVAEVSPEPVVPATSPAPPPTPRPVDFVMPDLVGVNLQDAQDAVQTRGILFSLSHDLLGSRSQVLDENWNVCSQTPSPGAPVVGDAVDFEGKIDFGVVKLSESCPQRVARGGGTAPSSSGCRPVAQALLDEIASTPKPGVSPLVLPSAYEVRGERGFVVGGFLSSADGFGEVDGRYGTWFVSFDGEVFAYTDAALELTDWPAAGDGSETDRTRIVRGCAKSNAG